jgi:transcription antitermination factor NusA-like protein
MQDSMGMKLPICAFCANSSALCAVDEPRLEAGEIDQADIIISRAIARIGRRSRALQESEIVRGFDLGDRLVIITREEDVGRIIGKKGTRVKRLTDTLGKRVVVVGQRDDVRGIVDRIIYPGRLRAISNVYTDTGSKRLVEVNRAGEIDLDRFVAMLAFLFGGEFEVRVLDKKKRDDE